MIGLSRPRRHGRHPPKQQVLSTRQKQVFALLEKGCTLKEIADELGLSINTIKGHGKALRQKLGDAQNARTAISNFYRSAR